MNYLLCSHRGVFVSCPLFLCLFGAVEACNSRCEQSTIWCTAEKAQASKDNKYFHLKDLFPAKIDHMRILFRHFQILNCFLWEAQENAESVWRPTTLCVQVWHWTAYKTLTLDFPFISFLFLWSFWTWICLLVCTGSGAPSYITFRY